MHGKGASMDVIARITELMILRGWSKYRLAKESGISNSTIGNMFRRNSIPDIQTIEMLCKGMKITMSQFFAENELVELDAEQQETIFKLGFLTSRQKGVVSDLINSYYDVGKRPD